MKDDFKITVVFNPELIDKIKAGANKNIYSKSPVEKKKNELKARLERRAAEDNVRFRKRKLSRLFNPVFSGYITFSDGIKLDEGGLCRFADLFFEKMEKDFDVNIINYSLKDIKNKARAEGYIPNFFEFEVFNYNFEEHRAIKSEFVKPQNIKKIVGIAESVVRGFENKNIEKAKSTAKPSGKAKKEGVSAEKTKPARKTVPKSCKPGAIKPAKAKKEKFASGLPGAPEICETAVEKGITEQINLISLNWKLLSPAENIPVLEAGEPVEIYRESMVRIYFQKPNVRQVVWRFRKKPESESSAPILRVYEGGDLLWYETLEGLSGSRYIIFSDEPELSRTWVEIGYLTEKGDFIFIARSPVWPPFCLLRKLPKLNMERKIPKGTRLIGWGATENLSGENPGGGFSRSGEGFSGSGAGIR